ncbi:transcription termination factor NusA [Candidatus Jorgensenbacteria bacterium RIFCSPLOWO2_12_FULL_42_11]|uniref:Transcription termination/antitermination protein NusA n=1 Tax=Candidatus Jorgensenbacteria bacterium RIFCSPLOWO2_12_FULL_42_11 TaxID=1798473 RepID=A0A1F6C2K1_9BACT|nr:MAG: transcription termination factor NusA [Candidatus Jorgensenbacteria bacterium RIFCSPLOWO2_12_FULL_42_11]
MDLKTLASAVNQISEERGIEPKEVLAGIEEAIAAAYKKQYRERSEIVKSKFDLKTGALKFRQVKTVVDETTVRFDEAEQAEGGATISSVEEEKPRYNPDRHILFEEAKKIKPDVALDEELEFPLEEHEDFGRIAAQTAKQVILQKLKESEREAVRAEFQGKEGEIISGVVQRFDRGNVYVDLGRTLGVMFPNECIPGEHYRLNERLRFYVLAVQEDAKLPGVILSRSHPQFVVKLFELEVPEVAEGVVEIKAMARESGHRTKVSVYSKEEKVDPVGSMVGQRGTRVMAVTNELGNEKIDIIEWAEEPAKFIANAFSPAKVISVEILPRREARVFVAEDQLSLALGKGGENVRLAAKLTGFKIDVRSQSRPEEIQQGGVVDVEETPAANIVAEEIKKAEQTEKPE